MSDKTKEKVKCTIPIKVDSYEALFNEFDYRDVKDRNINSDLDGWIQEYILRVPYKLKNIDVELEVNMPVEVRDENKEEISKESIINSYKEFLSREKKLSFMGVIRIGYYIIAAAILLSCSSISLVPSKTNKTTSERSIALIARRTLYFSAFSYILPCFLIPAVSITT